MPKAMHDRLARQASKRGLKGKKRAAYVYGTLAKVAGRRARSRKR